MTERQEAIKTGARQRKIDLSYEIEGNKIN